MGGKKSEIKEGPCQENLGIWKKTFSNWEEISTFFVHTKKVQATGLYFPDNMEECVKQVGVAIQRTYIEDLSIVISQYQS